MTFNRTEQASVLLFGADKVMSMWAEFLKLMHILFSYALGHNLETFLCRRTSSSGVPEGLLQVRFCDRTEYMVKHILCAVCMDMVCT